VRDEPTIGQVVQRVELWQGKEVTVSALSGGLTNANYLVEADGARYVVRIPGRSTQLLAVNRENERHNAEAAATTGVAPRILEYLPEFSVMVVEFIDGETMSAARLRSPAMARRMGESLRRLHTAPQFRQDFDMFRLVEFYLDVCDEHHVTIPQGFRSRMREVAEIERAFGARRVDPRPCHNDLLAENYIDDGTQLWILDFEYSGNNDPCFELGDTAQECGFNQDLRAVLCEAYFGEARADLLARMNLQAVMADAGWTLWAAIQAKISPIDYDFWGWAVERWDRAATAIDSEDFPRWLRDSAGA
jgi:thiamine kinase-like enzyme